MAQVARRKDLGASASEGEAKGAAGARAELGRRGGSGGGGESPAAAWRGAADAWRSVCGQPVSRGGRSSVSSVAAQLILQRQQNAHALLELAALRLQASLF